MKNKTVRKIAAAALCAVICAASCLAVFAAGKTYTVKECDDLQITLPENMSAITRSSKESDPYFSLHNLNYNEVMNDFSNGQIYLQSMDNVEAITLTLSCIENEQSRSIGDYNKLSASELEKVAQNFIGESGSEASYNSSTVDETSRSAVWLYFNLTAKENGASFDQYQATTVHNGKSYSLTLYRNGGDVNAGDYAVLKDIVSTVKFQDTQQPFIGSMLFYIIIGGAVVVIILIIVIIVAVSRAKKRRKQSQNDKILQELAGKYKTNRPGGTSGAEEYADENTGAYGDGFGTDEPSEITDATAPEKEAEAPADGNTENDYDFETFDDDVDRKYSDEDIARLLGDIEDDENFINALPEMQADSDELSEVRDSVIENDDEISEFFEDEEQDNDSQPAAAEAEAAYPEEITENDIPEAEESEKSEKSEKPEEPEETEDVLADEAFTEEAEADAEPKDGVEYIEPEASEESAEPELPEGSDDGSEQDDEDFDEFVNDEVLAREESNQDKFKDSNDFFEEAPRKVIGVISRNEIEEAEEYDVIGEVEQRAEELEKETPTAGESFSRAMKKVGGGFKSFFTHCGYFATNVRREIKRSRARKKRKKAEEERRRRQAERRQQARERQRTDGGLVRVRSRGDRRPPKKR